jgi:tRNA(fMet)-specific endonuclease VapC
VIHLLDTNILIYWIKRHPPRVAERIDSLSEDDSLAMSFITWAELLQGAEGSQRREATLRQLEVLARQVPVLCPEGTSICRHYAEQATALKETLIKPPISGDTCLIFANETSLSHF